MSNSDNNKANKKLTPEQLDSEIDRLTQQDLDVSLIKDLYNEDSKNKELLNAYIVLRQELQRRQKRANDVVKALIKDLNNVLHKR